MNCVYGALFLADTPVKIGVLFQNVASDATQLTALAFLDTRFTQIPIQPEPPSPPLVDSATPPSPEAEAPAAP